MSRIANLARTDIFHYKVFIEREQIANQMSEADLTIEHKKMLSGI